MNGLFKHANAGEWAKLLGPFVGSGLLGGGLIWFGIAYYYAFVIALGDAFVIAGIIGVCLELFAASRIIEHASDQVSAKMAGYGLPKAAQDLIYDVVHKTKLVYREYRKTYRIVRHETKPNTVVIHLTLSYRVVNNGKGKERYRPLLFEEGMYLPVVISLQYGKHSIALVDLHQETLAGGVQFFRPKAHVWISSSDSNVAPENLRDDQMCLVRWAYQIEMHEYYSDVTAFAGMTVNPVLELLEKPANFDFWASENNDCKRVGRIWAYERAFIAGQHVRAWWRPKP